MGNQPHKPAEPRSIADSLRQIFAEADDPKTPPARQAELEWFAAGLAE